MMMHWYGWGAEAGSNYGVMIGMAVHGLFCFILFLAFIMFIIWAVKALDKKRALKWLVWLVVIGILGSVLTQIVFHYGFKDFQKAGKFNFGNRMCPCAEQFGALKNPVSSENPAAPTPATPALPTP